MNITPFSNLFYLEQEKEAEPDSLFFSYFDLHFVKTDKEKCMSNSKNKKQKKSR